MRTKDIGEQPDSLADEHGRFIYNVGTSRHVMPPEREKEILNELGKNNPDVCKRLREAFDLYSRGTAEVRAAAKRRIDEFRKYLAGALTREDLQKSLISLRIP